MPAETTAAKTPKDSNGKDLLYTLYNRFELIGKLSKLLNTISLLIFFAMVLISFADVLLRYLFHSSLSGTKEYTEVLLIMVVSFSMPYTLYQDKHITVELIIGRMGKTLRAWWDILIAAITTVLIGYLLWNSIQLAIYYQSMGRVHGNTIMISSFPFQMCIVIGCMIMFLLCIRWILGCVLRYWDVSPGIGKTVVLLVTLAVLFGGSCWFVNSGSGMVSNGVLALLGILMMLLLIFAGVPTGFGIMLTGFVMIGHVRGYATAADMLSTNFYTTTSNYTWAVVGFFMLMGSLCYYAKFGDDIFNTVQKYFGRYKGGLAMVTIGASAALSGIMGDSTSVASTMSNIAYPQMKKYGYHDRLSAGVIASGSLLGPLIPPSTGFILFASLTGVSLGKLFVAGIVPGLIMAGVFLLTIYILCTLRPDMGPRGPKYSRRERFSSLKYGAPILILFILVIAGVYTGIFTATEGGAVGCFGALAIGLIMRRFTWKSFLSALIDSGSTLGMIFNVIIGASLFSRFLAWCNLSQILTDFFLNLHVSPKLFVLIVLVFFFLLGFFVDIIPMLLLGIPIFYPIASAMGIDIIWFAVLLVVTIQTGVITPPFASLLFAMKGMMPGVRIEDIFNGVWPFVAATALTIIILYLFPGLVTWLPYLLS